MGVTLRQVGEKSVFDEAREQIAEWERLDPGATHIALVLDGETDLVVYTAGDTMQPTAAAGLLFGAAQLVLQ